MDRHQAEQAAEAILQGERARCGLTTEQRRVVAMRAAAQHRRQRLTAVFVVAGFLVGLLAAWLTGTAWTRGVLWGEMAGIAAGWLVAFLLWRRERRAQADTHGAGA